MRRRQVITVLLAAALLAPSTAAAHGGDRGRHDDRGRSARSAQDSGDRHGKDHRFQGRGEGHFRAGSGDDDRRRSTVRVKAATEVREETSRRHAKPEAGHNKGGSAGIQHDPTPAPTPTAVPARIVGHFKLNGTIGSTTDGSIVVNGQTIVVDPDTTKVTHGPLTAGQQVKIHGFLKSDGTFVARHVQVRAEAVASPEPSASPTAEPSAVPTPEATPTVTPTEEPTASPSPSPTASPEPEIRYVGSFTLRGTITAVNDDSFELNGQTIMITDDTKVRVKGDLNVGQRVLVKGGITTEGELVGRNVVRQHDWFFAAFWRWLKDFWS